MSPRYFVLFIVPIALTMSSASEDSDTELPKVTRKRKRQCEQWTSSVRKQKRNSGQAYTNRKNIVVAAKTVGAPCTCAAKCFDVVGRGNIQVIFDNYWGLSDYNVQTAYLATLVQRHDAKRSRVQGRPSRSLCRKVYTVKCGEGSKQVCLVAFLHIHGVTEKRVRCAINKLSVSGTSEPDKRGRKEPGNKVTANKRAMVKEHIEHLSTVTSHYSRAKSPHRRYLPPGLNINLLYDSYVEWMRSENKSEENIVKAWYYRNVFNNDYNIGFEPPSSDTCNKCDKINNELEGLVTGRDDDKIRELKVVKVVHLARASAGQRILKQYIGDKDNDLACICIDLQQALPTPKLSTGLQFYKRKLWTYNFGVHNVKTRKACMFVWTETEAKRGSSEIASCLDYYIQHKMEPHIKKLVIFSDNCSGQNKNRNIVLSCLRNIHSGRFDFIKHYFMVPGHSYLPCDRDFGNIEQKIRHIPVYTPEHYIDKIKEARRKNPFDVVKMQRADFKNYDELQASVVWTLLKNSGFSQARVFQYSKDFKDGFNVYKFYGDIIPPVKVCLKKKRCKTPLNLSGVLLSSKYPVPVKLSAEKLRDVKDLMQFVSASNPQYMTFYEDLMREQEADVGGVAGHDRDDPDDDLLEF